MSQEQVSLPVDYFARTVRQDYVDWPSAFVREMFQNQVDAGSTSIDLSFDNGVFRGEDNGRGMNRDTLENVLLTLLGTDKGEGDVGGKGRAKEILYLAWPEWSIRTQNLLVEGSLINYTIKEVSETINGTISTVHLGDRNLNLEKIFLEYAGKCSFDQDVTWNGKSVRGMGKLTELEFLEEIKFPFINGPVGEDGLQYVTIPTYAMKGRDLYVRSNGLFMFSKPFRTDRGLIMEIPKGKSKDLLTGNRDGFVNPHREFIEMKMMALSAKDAKGNINGARSLWGHRDDEREKDHEAEAVKKDDYWQLVSPLRYSVSESLEDLFYDHNLGGKHILIELDTPVSEQLGEETYHYRHLVGKSADLEEGTVVFEKVVFHPMDDAMRRAYDGGNIMFKARGSFSKTLDEDSRVIPFAYEGDVEVYDVVITT